MNIYKSYFYILLMLQFSGCSVIEKSLKFVKNDKQNEWILDKNNIVKNHFSWKIPNLRWSSYQYYSKDSICSLTLKFSNIFHNKGSVLFGPPLIPIFPTFHMIKRIKRYEFLIQIGISNSESLSDSILEYVNFNLNDSIIKPYSFSRKSTERNNNNNILLYTFVIDSLKIKTLKIDFDEKFNSIIKANFNAILLRKKNEFYYSPFCIYCWE